MHGIPMYAPRQVCKVFVTIAYPDGRFDLKLWKGRNKKSIIKAARTYYTGAKLRFGNQFYCNV